MNFPPEIAITLNDLARLEHLVTDFNLLPRQPAQSVLSGKHASKLRGRGLDFSEVRKYVFGDDIRNIDWKVTARTRVTHTKVFNEEKEKPAFIIIDQSSSMFFASQGTVKSVLAAKLAAIAGYKILKSGDRIGGLVFDDYGYETIIPKRNRKSLMRLLKLIVLKNQKLATGKNTTSSEDGIINRVLFQAKNMVTHDYLVLVISDLKKLDQQGRQYLGELARHNDVIAISIYDAMEYWLPTVKMPVSDGELQVMIADKENIRNRFRASTEKIREENLNYFRKYNIPIMRINTNDPLIDQLKQVFGKR